MSYQLREINDRIRSDTKGFLEECDARYQARVEEAAGQIVNHINQSPVVLLSGPSGSGKTTTAMKIEEVLDRKGISTHTISMDNYFRTVDPETSPRTKNGDYDLESPFCLDLDLLNRHIDLLGRGEEIQIPDFNFSRQMRSPDRHTMLCLKKNEVAIFEGIHALNDLFVSQHPNAFKLYISARSNILDGDTLVFKGTWIRLSRRAVRDFKFRGSDVAFTLSLWDNVRQGEKRYISPYKHLANLMFDSTLPYEVSVLKHYALPLFEALPEENQRKNELLNMIAAFDSFEPVDPVLVRPDSLLREFIGDGSYHYS